MNWYVPAGQLDTDQCEWCYGAGEVMRTTAYVPGPETFTDPMQSATHLARCKPCQGTGTYHSALDPTLDHERDDR